MGDAPKSAQEQATEHIEKAFRLLGIVTEDDPETTGTPERVTNMIGRLYSGMAPDKIPPLSVTDYEGENLVLIKSLPYYSMCAHHMLPFFGHAHIAYIPNGKVVGLGSFPKVLDYFSRRPQLQERLAEQIADYLDQSLQSKGLIVFLSARQMCVEMRGASTTCMVEYAATRGVMQEGDWRNEFFKRIS